MNKYFGTDGIRGKYGEEVTVELVNQVGSAAGFIFGSGKKVCIGRDTRESGLEIEVILATKLVSFGVEIELLGVISTPVISFVIIN
nr:phosphoglucosamine mutase [Mycoplasmatales bacterium]